MSLATRLNRRITHLAVGSHLPHRTVRVRLTLLYGGLFLLSGAVLVTIAYVLFVNATGFVFTGQNGWTDEISHGHTINLSHAMPAGLRDLHQLPALPIQFVGSITEAQARRLSAEGIRAHGHVLRYLALESAIALAGMSVLSLALGWLVAGRVLQPLEDSYHAQRQFVANASHELRAPLTRQRALIEVALASPEADAGSLRAAHERVLASEQDLEQLIDALLALSRGQAGLERRDHVDLAALASEALRAREPELAGLDVRATVTTATTAGDKRLLERLIANLIDNAIRHNCAHGRVEVTTGTRDRHAFATIANTGPAVPPEEVGRLFAPFQRLGGARTRHDGGHGLGLAIVQAIADAHHAQLTARPRADGGLTIDVSFPAATSPSPGPAFAQAPEPAAPLRS
jgi:signal transduction histidine kinase